MADQPLDTPIDTPTSRQRSSAFDALAALSEIKVTGESPSDTVRRIRTEIAALRGALRDAHEQRDLAYAAASKARDEAEDERREREALEWLALNGYPVGRCPHTRRVAAVYRDEDAEPDWKASWVEAAEACGWEG